MDFVRVKGVNSLGIDPLNDSSQYNCYVTCVFHKFHKDSGSSFFCVEMVVFRKLFVTVKKKLYMYIRA